jgi:hypothetical protein
MSQDSCLVAYYPFNGNANDLSGNENDGTVHNATLTTDRFGNVSSAYYFDGIDDYIISNLNGQYDALTVSFWYNAPPSTNYYSTFYAFNDSYIWTQYGSWSPYISGDIKVLPSNEGLMNLPIPNFDQWHFIVVQHDFINKTKALYVDDILDSVFIYSGNPDLSFTSFQIGWGQFGGSNEFFNGFIDDICIYKCELSQTQVDSLYSYTTSIYDYDLKENLSIYPNPADNTIKVKVNIDDMINIYDIGGKLIQSIKSTQEINDIDISHLLPGIYILKLIDDKYIVTEKIIKE